MKFCIACGLEKPESEFSRKGDKFQHRCKACFKIYHQQYYEKNKEKYFAKNRRNKNRQRARLRKIIWEKKQCPCQDCGKTFHPWVMEFDHRHGSKKVAAVGSMVARGCTDEQLKNEIEKCDVVCANCHRMRTFHRLQDKTTL
jgi:5-methylcytosine-specific restriction endonuclease McrA